MRVATGRWVSGEDFHDRERELQILESRVRDGNHTLLTGQRRMGKTGVLRELGRRLEAEGWVFLFADVEAATHPEDAVAELARPFTRFAPSPHVWRRRRVDGSRPTSRKSARTSSASRSGQDSMREHGAGTVNGCSGTVRNTMPTCFWSSTNCPFFSSGYFAERMGFNT